MSLRGPALGVLMAWLVAAPFLAAAPAPDATAPGPHVDTARAPADDADDLGVEVLAAQDAPAHRALDGAGALYEEAQRELALARHTAYAHTTGVDEAAGRFVFDCSGFVGYAMRRAVPEAFAQLQALTSLRPTSQDFVRFVQSLEPDAALGRWRRVGRVDALQPGDIVAWLRPRGRNAGHVMIVGAAPYEYPEGSGEYVLRIIDSSGSRRAPRGDVRAARRMTGLGVGRVVLDTGPDGAPVAFRWSSEGRSRRYPSTIVLG